METRGQIRSHSHHLTVSGTPSALGGSVRGRKALLPDTIRKCEYNSMNQKKHGKKENLSPTITPNSQYICPSTTYNQSIKKKNERNPTSTQKRAVSLEMKILNTFSFLLCYVFILLRTSLLVLLFLRVAPTLMRWVF